MEITWLGTAGFQICVKDQVFFLDPFLSRNRAADPVQSITPAHITHADALFISHGHFDHIMDVPNIVSVTQGRVHCSETVASTLAQQGVDKIKVQKVTRDDAHYAFENFNARAFFSTHVKFDAKLVFTTLFKINFRIFKYRHLMRDYPCGQVLSWRFYIEDKVIQFFGSAGATGEELVRIKDEPIDILLLPLQGNSHICSIGSRIVERLEPKTVIVQHHDNFFPPISASQDIQPFLDSVCDQFPQMNVIVPRINHPIQI